MNSHHKKMEQEMGGQELDSRLIETVPSSSIEELNYSSPIILIFLIVKPSFRNE